MLQVSDHCGLNGRLLQLLINTWHLKLFIGVFVMFPFRKFLSKIFFFENFDFLSFCGWSGQSRTFRTVCGVFSHPDCPISTPSRGWSVGDQYMRFFFSFTDVHDSLRGIFTTWWSHQYTQPWVISGWSVHEIFFFFFAFTDVHDSLRGIFTPWMSHQYTQPWASVCQSGP